MNHASKLQTRVRRRVPPAREAQAFVLALLAALAAPVGAQGLSVVEARNQSTSAYEIVFPQIATRFDSALTVGTPVQEANATTIEWRLSWAVAREIQASVPAVPLPTSTLGWSMVLRVEDPLDQGYALDVGSRLRGTLGAQAQSIGNIYDNGLPPFRFAFYEQFDALPTALPDAELPAGGMSFGLISPFETRLRLDQQGAAELGRFRGTRSFLFVLEPVALQLRLDNLGLGSAYAWQQFGHRLSGSAWNFSDPEPGTDLQNLGQIFQVTATFNTPAIPEPGGIWLMALGSAFLLWRWRGHGRRTAGS